MIITEYEHWLVVRQGRRRRIYRVTLVATVSRTLRTPLVPALESAVVSCNYDGFISGACVSPRDVYTARAVLEQREAGHGDPRGLYKEGGDVSSPPRARSGTRDRKSVV